MNAVAVSRPVCLTVREFTGYARNAKLGRLFLPNGLMWCHCSNKDVQLSIDLSTLYVPGAHQLFAIVVFGEAVTFPGYEVLVEPRMLDWLLGRRIACLPTVCPVAVDLLMITFSGEPSFITREEEFDLFDGEKVLVSTGITVRTLSLGNISAALADGDLELSAALCDGVLLAGDFTQYDTFLECTGLARTNPRQAVWLLDHDSCLSAAILDPDTERLTY